MTDADEVREEGDALAQILSQLTTLNDKVTGISERLAVVEGNSAGTNARLAVLETRGAASTGSSTTVEGEDPDDNLAYVPHFAQQNPYPVRPPTAPEKPILYELRREVARRRVGDCQFFVVLSQCDGALCARRGRWGRP